MMGLCLNLKWLKLGPTSVNHTSITSPLDPHPAVNVPKLSGPVYRAGEGPFKGRSYSSAPGSPSGLLSLVLREGAQWPVVPVWLASLPASPWAPGKLLLLLPSRPLLLCDQAGAVSVVL